jgi:hypothetical protein
MNLYFVTFLFLVSGAASSTFLKSQHFLRKGEGQTQAIVISNDIPIPRCPPTSSCTFKKYWSQVSKDHCTGVIRPAAINICNWIKANCKFGSKIIDIVVPVVVDDDHICKKRPTCPEGSPAECFTDKWCMCNNPGNTKKKKNGGALSKYQLTSEQGCSEVEKMPYCSWKEEGCHKREKCGESEICKNLGRISLEESPCDRCGECFQSPAHVCPLDPRDGLLTVVGGGSGDSQCMCECKEKKQCKAPLVFLESSCNCGCDDETKQMECLNGKEGDPRPFHHTWDSSTCACTCDNMFDAATEVQNSFPECSITCNDDVIKKCGKKTPLGDCSGCGECATDLPECKHPMVRGDDCNCVCPASSNGLSAAESCAALHATLDEKTCGCKCEKECDNKKHVHGINGDCDICQCPAINDCKTLSPLNVVLSQETCIFECDTTVKCPGNQKNMPLSTSTSFLQLVEGASVCQCGCQCDPEAKSKCASDGKVFDELTCSCECKTCGDKMIAEPASCDCSCDEKSYQCPNKQQILVENEEKTACVCGCSKELFKAIEGGGEKFMVEESTCSKVCNDETECKVAKMIRVLEKDCECQCGASLIAECVGKGGKIDEKTCECSCESPAPPYQLSKDAKYPNCDLECLPNDKCKTPLGVLDATDQCECKCTKEAIDKCIGKGEPTPPSCDKCGKCNQPIEQCNERQTFNHESCKCECKDVTALQCPEGNTGVDDKCGCICPQPKEMFMVVSDPQNSCEATCSAKESCFSENYVTRASKETNCECSCDQEKCRGKKSKSVWKDEQNKKEGCQCICPLKPEKCEPGFEWNTEECSCTCADEKNSCMCGETKKSWEKYCTSVGMVATDQCSCKCSQDQINTCKGPLIKAEVVVDQGGNYQCFCGCNNRIQRCPGTLDARTDEKGYLPLERGGTINPSNANIDHLDYVPKACTCACPLNAWNSLVHSGRASERSKIILNDHTCTKTVCSKESIEYYKNYPPLSNRELKTWSSKTCQAECIQDSCPAGQQRQSYPNCQCNCPATSPVCSSKHSLSSDCSRCVCNDRKAPGGNMVQNPETCEFSCKPQYCPSGKSLQFVINRGCMCVCDVPSSICRQSNMILDPSTCQCECDSSLQRTSADGKTLVKLGNGVNEGCGYVCDKKSKEARKCIDQGQYYQESAETGKCGCQCPEKSCGKITFDDGYSLLYVNRMRSSGLCECSCSLRDLEALAGRCPNKLHKVNRDNCLCECPNFYETKRDCQSKGLPFDDKNCRCAAPRCPGNMLREDPANPNSRCICDFGKVLNNHIYYDNTNRIDRRNYIYDHQNLYDYDEYCNWDCSAQSKRNCANRNQGQEEFPHCKCKKIVPKRRKEINEHAEKCHWQGSYQSSFGEKDCLHSKSCIADCKTNSNVRCRWVNTGLGPRGGGCYPMGYKPPKAANTLANRPKWNRL